jgi:hypothetical protein
VARVGGLPVAHRRPFHGRLKASGAVLCVYGALLRRVGAGILSVMRPPDRISASPLPSTASRPGFLPRPTTFGQALREIALWWRSSQPGYQERMREARRIRRLALEIDEEAPESPERRGREDRQG